MRVLLFGATGMVGSAALIECLDDARVTAIVSIVRRPSGVTNAKVREVIHKDFVNFTAIQSEFANVDACFFCLGVTAAGKSEAEYTRLTYDITMAAARALVAVSPNATFCYVTGAGTDSSEKGRSMWARVKGRTENDLLALPFRAAYMFRPGAIVPLKGVRSSTPLYQFFYVVLSPFMGLLRRAFPNQVTTSVELGRAFISVSANGYPKKILDPADINVAGK
jgi:uncharacterized protein YbjT (DUF2867 family)